jgi:hypothetical protein
MQPELHSPLRLGGIGTQELGAVDAQWGKRSREGFLKPWIWENVLREKRDPARLALSIWSGGILSGLGFAVPKWTNKSSYLGVLYIEGNPDDAHPFKGFVTAIATEVADNYATALGLDELRIIDPFPKLEEYYVTKFGFRSIQERSNRLYCVREVTRD